MSTIQQTIQTALQNAGYGSYFEYAGPVVDALVERECAISDSLVDQAVEQTDLEPDEARNVLRRLGLNVAEPEPETEDEAEEAASTELSEILGAITALGERIDNLERLARTAGLR